TLPTTEKVAKELTAGEYTVVWVGTGDTSSTLAGRYLLRPATMTLNGGDGLAIMDLAIADHDKTLSVGGATTVTATGTLSNTGLQKNVGGAAKFTYTSSNPAVATVDETSGVVTAVSGGVAKITATCTNSSVIDGYNSISTLIAVDEPTTTVSFGADASVDGITITTDVEDYTQGEVGSVDLNTLVEVKAEPTAIVGGKTYVFRGWVRGKADGGRVISLDATYGFTAMTNTYLTAIYTEVADEEYYAWNGEFLGTEQPSAPEVVGYNFSEWKESLVNNIKRFVAWYVQKTETYGVTFNKATTQHKYDDPVTLSSDTDVYWYRDGKLVDYGKSYTFNVWDNTEITTSSEGHNLPMLALDAKAKSGTYMVEYDANGKNVIEVGILFNAEADGAPIVSSCKEKMSSQRNLAENPHGQFAAKAGSYTKARGYLIYEDNGAYKVIYSE
ncbi:MAG: Ig-like domain-containing protein, partial [Oscillospiraceae bacterium]|nr:Ig-like domain-containing protein [Oscillospiraceae bacterium]